MSTSTIFIIRQVVYKQADVDIYFFIPLQEIIHHSLTLTVPLTAQQNKIYKRTVAPPCQSPLVIDNLQKVTSYPKHHNFSSQNLAD